MTRENKGNGKLQVIGGAHVATDGLHHYLKQCGKRNLSLPIQSDSAGQQSPSRFGGRNAQRRKPRRCRRRRAEWIWWKRFLDLGGESLKLQIMWDTHPGYCWLGVNHTESRESQWPFFRLTERIMTNGMTQLTTVTTMELDDPKTHSIPFRTISSTPHIKSRKLLRQVHILTMRRRRRTLWNR